MRHQEGPRDSRRERGRVIGSPRTAWGHGQKGKGLKEGWSALGLRQSWAKRGKKRASEMEFTPQEQGWGPERAIPCLVL